MRVNKSLDQMLADIGQNNHERITAMQIEDDVLERVRSSISREIPDKKLSYQFDMVFYEVLSNALEHGNKNLPGSGADVDVYVGEKGIVIDVKDQGQGYDVEKKFEEAAKRLKRAVEGSTESRNLGLYIFLAFPTVNVSVQENGTRVLLQYMRK